jgi:WD40 repeat protein
MPQGSSGTAKRGNDVAIGNEPSAGTRISDVRNVRETLKVPIEGYGLAVSLSSGGKVLALGGMVPSQNGLIHLFDNTGKLHWRHKTREAISIVAMSRTGDFIAAASDDGNIYFFDKKGLLLWRHEAQKLMKGLAISENGDFMAAGGEDCNVHFFDKNRPLKKFVWKYKFDKTVTSVDISAKGTFVLAGSADNTAGYFDSAGQLLWSHEAKEAITSVKLSADGGRVAVGSADRSVYYFDATGTLLWSHDCGAPVNAIGLSVTGDAVVAAAGKLIIGLDSKGEMTWSVELDSSVVNLVATDKADMMLATTEGMTVNFVTRHGVLAWTFKSAGGIYGLDLSEDGELGVSCGPSEMNFFEGGKIFRELLARHQGALHAAKHEGRDVSAAENSLRQAINHLNNRNYSGVAESLNEIQTSLSALDKLAAEREKLRKDTGDAITKLLIAIDDLEEQGRALTITSSSRGGIPAPSTGEAEMDPRIRSLSELAAKASLAHKGGKFSEALAIVGAADETIHEIKRAHDARNEAGDMIDSLETRIIEAQKLEVKTDKAEIILQQAKGHFRAGDFDQAIAMAQHASSSLSAAKSGSKKAVEVDFARACRILESPTISDSDLSFAEDGINNAISYFLEKKDFSGLAGTYEKLAGCWLKRDPSVGARGYSNAMIGALNGHRDAGNVAKAIELAGQMGDWTTAAKLHMAAGDKDKAAEAWKKAAAAKKPKPAIPEGMKLQAEKYLAQGRFYDAAEELARGGFVLEASKVLAREKPSIQTAVFMYRLLFNLLDFQSMMDKSKLYLGTVKKEFTESMDSKDMAGYAHLLVGTLELASLMDSPDVPALQDELRQLAQQYNMGVAKDEFIPKDEADMALLYCYFMDRNWKAVERLADSRSGEFWQRLKTTLAAWKDVNVNMFRQELNNLVKAKIAGSRYPGQSLSEVVPPSDPHAGLNAMQPFNITHNIFHMLDQFSSKDHLTTLVAHGDSLGAAGKHDEAALLYENALVRDTFGLLDGKRVHLRVAGCYLMLKKEAAAAPHLEAAGAAREAALTEVRNLRGHAAPSAKGSKGPSAQAGGKEGPTCPKCGVSVPKRALRCFKCGAQLQ